MPQSGLLNKIMIALLVLFPGILMIVPKGGGVVALGLVAASIVGLLRNRQKCPLGSTEKNLLIAIGVYILIYVANIVYFGSPVSKLDNTTRFILLLPVFFYLRKSEVPPEAVVYGIILGAAACFAIAVYQVAVLGLYRAEGITNAVPFGGISMTLAMMCIAIVILTEHWRIKALAYCGFMLGIAAAVLSGSRGAWLAMIPALIFFLLINPRNWKSRTRTAFAVVVICCLVASYAIPDIQSRIDRAAQEIDAYFTSGLASTSVGLRLETWLAASIGFINHPLLGIGEGNFRDMIHQLAGEGRIDSVAAKVIAHVHNEYLSSALHRGAPGLISLLAILLLPLVAFARHLKHSNGTQRLLLGSGVMMIISTMTTSLSDVFFQHHNATLFFVMYLYIIVALTGANWRQQDRRSL